MGTVHSKLLIITSDFVLVKQNRNGIQASCNAIHICDVDQNLETRKTSIFYPDTNSLKENNVKKDQLNNLENIGIVWNCVANEEVNNILRDKLENASLIIVSDKVTQNLLQNFVENDNVTFVVR